MSVTGTKTLPVAIKSVRLLHVCCLKQISWASNGFLWNTNQKYIYNKITFSVSQIQDGHHNFNLIANTKSSYSSDSSADVERKFGVPAAEGPRPIFSEIGPPLFN